MLTTARIRADLQPAGLDWISALTTKHLRKLVAAPGAGGAGPEGPSPAGGRQPGSGCRRRDHEPGLPRRAARPRPAAPGYKRAPAGRARPLSPPPRFPGRREAADTARVAAAVVMPGCGQSDALTTKHLRKLVAAPGQCGAGPEGPCPAGRASGRHQRLDTCQGFGIRERGGNPVLFVHALGVAQ